MKRTRLIAIVLVVTVLSAAGGWLLGSRIQSPAEVAAQTAAPAPSPILVPAEMRVLSTDIITRGVGRYGSPKVVSLAPSALKPELRVVTSVADAGTNLEVGDILATISGRPVFVMQGEVPSFRDLGPGIEGADVLQLEESLAVLGMDPGEPDGVYDDRTASAVATFYRSNNYQPVVITRSQVADLRPVISQFVAGAALEAGTILPADEVVFLSSPPVRLSEVLSEPGLAVDGSLATVTDANIAIDSSVPIESAGLIHEGMSVVIDEPDLGISGEGTISFVAAGPGTDGVDGFHVYFEVSVPDGQPNLVNASVRLTIPTGSTGGPVLAVPVSALALGTDGASRVQVSRGQSIDFVNVQPGLSAKGFVEVTPVGDGVLESGDMVVVGIETLPG